MFEIIWIATVFVVGTFVAGMGVGVKLQQYAFKKAWEKEGKTKFKVKG